MQIDGEHQEHRPSSSGLQFQLHPVSGLLAGKRLLLSEIETRGAPPLGCRPADHKTCSRFCLSCARTPCPHRLQLVLINISDHHTRTRANAGAAPGAAVRVLGCLLGSQAGRTVDIANSFEMRLKAGGNAADIDEAFLQKKMEQCELGCLQASRTPASCLEVLRPSARVASLSEAAS